MNVHTTYTVLEPGVLAYMALVDGKRELAKRLFAAQDALNALKRGVQ